MGAVLFLSFVTSAQDNSVDFGINCDARAYQWNYTGFDGDSRDFQFGAIGYAESSDCILLLGGPLNSIDDREALTNFSITDSIFQHIKTSGSFLPANGAHVLARYVASGKSQFWTQVGEYIYMPASTDGVLGSDFSISSILRFNVNSYTAIPEWKRFDSDVTFTSSANHACLTSYEDENGNNYLILLGDGSEQEHISNQMQVLDISTGAWLPPDTLSPMTTERADFACIVNQNKLYAIGGADGGQQSIGSVEVLTISGPSFSGNWTILNDLLNKTENDTLSGLRAVSYKTNVFVIGIGNINVIDSIKDTIEQWITCGFSGNALGSPSIIVDSTLYIFWVETSGNSEVNSMEFKWAYFDLDALYTNNSTEFPTASPTSIPSSSPTQSPTADPSISPTMQPTTATSDPTTSTTSSPTANTNSPTEFPTVSPTSIPSSPPTQSQTDDPTIAPSSSSSTQTPTALPTQPPINDPSTEPIDPGATSANATESPSTPSSDVNSNDLDNKEEDELQSTFYNILIFLTSSFAVVGIAGFIDAKYCRINDFYRISALFQALIQILDALSDSFLAYEIGTNANGKMDAKTVNIAFSICMICIMAPSLVSLLQIYYFSHRHWAAKSNKIRSWLLKHSKLLYLIAVLTGSAFTATEIMNSHLFGMDLFEMGLTQKQLIKFKTHRIYSTIMLENIPQLALQTWYIVKYSSSNSDIAVASAFFSAISIAVTVLSMFLERSLIKSQEHTLIVVDVCGRNMDYRKIKGKVNGIRNKVSAMIGVEAGLMEMMPIEIIQKGFRLKMDVSVDNAQSREENYLQTLEDAQRNGMLAKTIFDCWKLTDMPIISAVKCLDFESSEMKKRIKMEGMVPSYSPRAI